jgi:hypothetical protein
MSKITERLIARVWSITAVLVLCEDVTSYPLDVLTSWLVDLQGQGRKVCFKRYVDG